jgi:hypothetical protein
MGVSGVWSVFLEQRVQRAGFAVKHLGAFVDLQGHANVLVYKLVLKMGPGACQ